MDSRLTDEVNKNSIVKQGVKLKRVRFPFGGEQKPTNAEPLDLDLIPGK